MPTLQRFINFKGSASDLSDAAIKCGEDYGFKVDEDKIHYYIMDKLRHIDDITPLNN